MIITIQKIYIKVTKKKDLFSVFGYDFKNLAKIVIFKISNIYIWMFVNTINDNITFFRVNYFNKCRFLLVRFTNIKIRTRFIKQVSSNVKECAPSWSLSRGKLSGIISQVNISSKRGLFCNSGFSNSNYVKYFICALE